MPDQAYYSRQSALADAASIPEDPVALTVTPTLPAALLVSWSGTGSEYRLLRRIGSFPAGPEDPDATLAYEGSDSATVETDLSISEEYFYRVWSKVPEMSVFSSNPSEAVWTSKIHADRFELSP